LLSSDKFEDFEDERMIELANVLKDSGCALGTCNMQGSNVLHCAAERGSSKLMSLVLEWQKDPKYSLSLDEQNMEGSEYTEGEWSIVDGDSRYLTEEQKEKRKSQPNHYHDTVSIIFVGFFFFSFSSHILFLSLSLFLSFSLLCLPLLFTVVLLPVTLLMGSAWVLVPAMAAHGGGLGK
jgi:hypothetical protein